MSYLKSPLRSLHDANDQSNPLHIRIDGISQISQSLGFEDCMNTEGMSDFGDLDVFAGYCQVCPSMSLIIVDFIEKTSYNNKYTQVTRH